jgi:hypothetical protein
MYANKPQMAREWAAQTNWSKLPKKAKHKTVKMAKADFVKEHRHLVKVLKRGSKSQRIKEAKSQARELKKY